jgi:hypothetical protein
MTWISQARKSLNRAPADKVLNNLIDNYTPRFGTSWASMFLYTTTASIRILLQILAKFVLGLLFVGNLLTRCITSLEMVSDSSASRCYCCCIVSVLILHGTVKVLLSVICTLASAETSRIVINNWYKLFKRFSCFSENMWHYIENTKTVPAWCLIFYYNLKDFALAMANFFSGDLRAALHWISVVNLVVSWWLFSGAAVLMFEQGCVPCWGLSQCTKPYCLAETFLWQNNRK